MSYGPEYPKVAAHVSHEPGDSTIELALFNKFTHTYTGIAEATPDEMERALTIALTRVRELRERISQ